VTGKPTGKPFRYVDLGSAAYICRGRAVISAGPLRLSGRLGWLAWLFIHIMFLTGYRNRFTAVLTWLVAFSRGVRRERAFTMQEIETRVDVYAPESVVLPRQPAEVRPTST
jgi:NADH dehydrogenase